jgi:hypothetical protein
MRGWSGTGCVLLLLACCACDGGELSAATAAVEPHLQEFSRFDAWARRARSSDEVIRDREAMREAVFAPVRNDHSVIAAWVHADSRRAAELSMPDETRPPRVERWVTLRHDTLGALRVARAGRCPVDVPGWWRQGAGQGPCVIVSRSEPYVPGGEVTVTVAFRAEQVSSEDP